MFLFIGRDVNAENILEVLFSREDQERNLPEDAMDRPGSPTHFECSAKPSASVRQTSDLDEIATLEDMFKNVLSLRPEERLSDAMLEPFRKIYSQRQTVVAIAAEDPHSISERKRTSNEKTKFDAPSHFSEIQEEMEQAKELKL